MKLHKDIRYSESHLMDVYSPDDPSGGAVLAFHSGWFDGDKGDLPDVAEALCKVGLHVFVPSFRIPPNTLFSAARSDALASANWMMGSDFEFDRSSVAVWGFSAGGTLAVEVALATGMAGVTWSAMIDLKGFMQETTSMADKDYDHDFSNMGREAIEAGGRNDALLRTLVLQLVANNASWLETYTPLCRVSKAAGSLLMFNAVDELVPADGAIQLQRALSSVGVPSTVAVLAGSLHGRRNFETSLPQALDFIRSGFATVDTHAAS